MANDYLSRPVGGQVSAGNFTQSGRLFSDALSGLQSNLKQRQANIQAEQEKANQQATQAIVAQIQQAQASGLQPGSDLGDTLRILQQSPQSSGIDLGTLNQAVAGRQDQLRGIASQQADRATEESRFRQRLGLDERSLASQDAYRRSQAANQTQQARINAFNAELAKNKFEQASQDRDLADLSVALYEGSIAIDDPRVAALDSVQQGILANRLQGLRSSASQSSQDRAIAEQERQIKQAQGISKITKDPLEAEALNYALSKGVNLQDAIPLLESGRTLLPGDDFDLDDFQRKLNEFIASGQGQGLTERNVQNLRNLQQR